MGHDLIPLTGPSRARQHSHHRRSLSLGAVLGETSNKADHVSLHHNREEMGR
jgi:hypothetical protein